MQISEGNALSLVLKALESKAITLLGPPNMMHAPGAGKADAEYLKALLSALMTETPKSP